MHDKLQKVLADLGIASRRKIEEWIAAGRIKVDGNIANIGIRVGPQASISIDNKPIHRRKKQPFLRKVILYHKPEGQICTRSDPENRPTVFQFLPPSQPGRWIAIGRLDFNTSGLLLFTNDGDLAHQLMHPSANIEREYAVRTFGHVDGNILRKLQQGVQLEDGMARFERIIHTGGSDLNTWYHVILTEGRNREVRRLWQTQDIKISRLIRVRFANIILPRDLKPGEWRELSDLQIRDLIASIKLKNSRI